MQYHISRRLDCVIWVIPCILAILLKPIAESYVAGFYITISKFKNMLAFNLLGSALGLYCVTCSTFVVEVLFDLSEVNFTHNVSKN